MKGVRKADDPPCQRRRRSVSTPERDMLIVRSRHWWVSWRLIVSPRTCAGDFSFSFWLTFFEKQLLVALPSPRSHVSNAFWLSHVFSISFFSSWAILSCFQVFNSCYSHTWTPPFTMSRELPFLFVLCLSTLLHRTCVLPWSLLCSPLWRYSCMAF